MTAAQSKENQLSEGSDDHTEALNKLIDNEVPFGKRIVVEGLAQGGYD